MDEYGWTNLGKRHFVTFMGFMFMFFINAHRLQIAVAILSMAKNTPSQEHLVNASSPSCPSPVKYENMNSTNTLNEASSEFEWDSLLQSYILSAGFLGYISTQVAGGRLAERFGAKVILTWANIAEAVLTLISPLVTQWGAYPFAVLQLLKGLAQGVLLPAVFVMMGLWIPKSERSLLNSMVINGYNFGSLFGGAITGWLCSMPQAGWASSFYVLGVLTAILSIVFHFVHFETPQSHKGISKKELAYITGGQEDDMTQECPPAPWRAILTSVQVWSLLFGYSGVFWIGTYFVASHPAYVGKVLRYPIRENGYISILPIAAQLVAICCCSVIVNWLIKKQYFKTNTLRKGFSAISTLGFCLMFLGVYLAGCDATVNLVCLIFAGFFGGVAILGAPITPVDMSPRFAGSVTGLAMTVSGVASVFCPIAIGMMTKNDSLVEWQNSFLLSVAVVLVCGIIFVVFGSAEVQPWNFIGKQEEQIQTIFSVSRDFEDSVVSLQTNKAKITSIAKLSGFTS